MLTKVITTNEIRMIEAEKSCFREALKSPSGAVGIRRRLKHRHLPELVAAHWPLDSLLLQLGCLKVYLAVADG
jgi:hypothetical protein